MNVEVPAKLYPLFEQLENPDSYHRFNVLKGGRGGGKSWAVALFLILKSMNEKCVVLCTREIQRTIKDSVHKLLSETIFRYDFENLFIIHKDKITCIRTGSTFIFTGLQNSAGIKSAEGITDCWIEESAKVSAESWKFLIPTIRQDKSRFYIVFNPDEESDPVNDFVNTPRPSTLIIDINYNDNPFFPDVLKTDMEFDKEHDFDLYLHVWEGQFWSKSDDQVMNGIWTIEEFETPDNVKLMYGADFGFAEDPSAGIRCFIDGKNLYIDYEVYGHHIENDDLVEFYRQLPDIDRHQVAADSSRPETISHIKRHGIKGFKSCKKGKNSIRDGIQFIRSHNVIIHPRCKNTVKEFKFYKHKRNPVTNEVLKDIIDKNNHLIDALRYALEDVNKYMTKSSVSASQLGM